MLLVYTSLQAEKESNICHIAAIFIWLMGCWLCMPTSVTTAYFKVFQTPVR